MIGVITLLGVQSLQEALSKRMGTGGIQFLCGDCPNEIAMITELEQHVAECDVILLNSAMIQSRNLEGILSEIRSLSTNVRVVLILNGMRKQYVNAQLDEYKNRFMVPDIIFEGNGIDLAMLANLITRGRLPKPELPPEPEQALECDAEIESHPQRSAAVYQKEKSTCKTIAVFGTAHGAGATNMVLTLAEYFALRGFCVKAVDLTGTDSLALIKGKAIYLTQRRLDLKAVKATCDFVVYDFGVPFRISAKGDFLGITPDYSLDMIYELKQSDLKIGMGLMDVWQIKKAEYFWNDEKWKRIIGNDYVFMFDQKPDELKSKYPHINMFYRNDPAFADIIDQLFINGGI